MTEIALEFQFPETHLTIRKSALIDVAQAMVNCNLTVYLVRHFFKF